jgi:hypothetical protein
MRAVATPTPDNPPARSPQRRRRRLGRLVLQGAILAAALLVAGLLVLPWVVHNRVLAALHELGVTDAKLVVRRALPWGTTITNVSALDGTVHIASIDVTYLPWGVLRGNVDHVRVAGVEIRLALRDGKLVAPVLSKQEPSASSNDVTLPFRSVELTSSQLVVDWEGQPVRLPISGNIERKGANRFTAKLSVGLETSGADVMLPGGAKLRSPAGVSLVDATADVRTGSPAVSVVGEIHTRGASLTHPASGLSLDGIEMRLPITINANPPAEPGRINIAAVSLHGQQPAPLSGTIGVRDKRLDFAARWAALPDSVLSADGWFSSDDAGMSGEIRASLPSAKLDDAATLAARVPALRGWQVTADGIGADATLIFTRGKPAGRISLSVAGADVMAKESGLELHDLSGEVAVLLKDGVISTPPGQHLAASRAAFGKVELTDASLAFQLERRDALVIENLAAGYLGGRVSTKDVRVDPAKPVFDATLVADRLSLRELLALTAEGRARGDGLMSGPIKLRFDGQNVSFLGGYLRSLSSSGELQVLDTKWLGEKMDQSDPRFSTQRELMLVKDRILSALADFSYDRLTFNFAEEPASRGRLTVSTHGKGRVGKEPQELDFTLNFRGVNDVLRHGLKLGEWYNKLTNPTIGR